MHRKSPTNDGNSYAAAIATATSITAGEWRELFINV